jgi:hypothetical protein
MTRGAQDDGAILAGGQTLTAAEAVAHSIEARTWRVIVSGRHGLDAYDQGIRQVCRDGFRVQLTLTFYTDERFVEDAMRRWGSCVAAWSFWNEPDLTLTNWRHRLPQLQRAGIRRARLLDPRARILIGETSPHTTPRQLRWLDRLPGDGLAVHPYQVDRSPRLKPRVWPTGIGALPNLARHLRHRLYITEFGYPPNQQRWMQAAERQARLAHAREFVLYQMLPEPDSVWDTALLDARLQPRSGARQLAGESSR